MNVGYAPSAFKKHITIEAWQSERRIDNMHLENLLFMHLSSLAPNTKSERQEEMLLTRSSGT